MDAAAMGTLSNSSKISSGPSPNSLWISPATMAYSVGGSGTPGGDSDGGSGGKKRAKRGSTMSRMLGGLGQKLLGSSKKG